MAYSPLGSSLPDLTISGFASPVASWGGQVTVTTNVQNIGASSTIEPLSLTPGAPSSADSTGYTVAVYAARNSRHLKGSVLIGTFDTGGQSQNSLIQTTATLPMPQEPAGFAGNGGKIYIYFVVNPSGAVLESNMANNASKPVALTIEAPLPELAVVGLDVPPTMQPGDTIQPNIRVANLGPADTNLQGSFTIDLVASTTPTFNQGSTIIAQYTFPNASIPNIPGESTVATQGSIFGDANLIPQRNVVTIVGDPVTLPTSPAKFYIGVVIDPANQLKQLHRVPQFSTPTNPFNLPHVVGPPIKYLPPAGVIVAGGANNVPAFPIPFGGLPVGGSTTGVFPPAYPPSLANTLGASASLSATGTVSASGKPSSIANIKMLRNGGRG